MINFICRDVNLNISKDAHELKFTTNKDRHIFYCKLITFSARKSVLRSSDRYQNSLELYIQRVSAPIKLQFVNSYLHI